MVRDHMDLAMAPVRMVTHPSTNWIHGCLTSVINHEMLTPSYQAYIAFDIHLLPHIISLDKLSIQI